MSIAIQLVIAGIIAIAGFAAGVKYHAGQDAIAEQARQVDQRATERLRRQNTNTAAAGHETDKIVIRKEFVPITQEVERVVTQVVYRDRACFDSDGVSVINSAVARANGTAGEPVNTVPEPAATE